MSKYISSSAAMLLGVLSCANVFGQAQPPVQYTRDNCIKVREGKWAEYEAYRKEVLKLTKLRVDSGRIARYVLVQAVAPTGRSARCDFHAFTTYNGFPPELSSADQTAADMKQAGITMTREAMLAKRDELTYLVSTDTWRWFATVGAGQKGGYGRINYYKVKPGMMASFVNSETTGWKPLAEAMNKENGSTWRGATLVMPGGTSHPYNAVTIDGFTSWESLGKGNPTRATWNKLHPNRDLSSHTNYINEIADRPRIDVVRIIEVLQK